MQTVGNPVRLFEWLFLATTEPCTNAASISLETLMLIFYTTSVLHAHMTAEGPLSNMIKLLEAQASVRRDTFLL